MIALCSPLAWNAREHLGPPRVLLCLFAHTLHSNSSGLTASKTWKQNVRSNLLWFCAHGLRQALIQYQRWGDTGLANRYRNTVGRALGRTGGSSC